MKNLIKAVMKVMEEVGNIDKNLNVGTGNSSYKGVSDKDVKLAFNRAMVKHGLVIFPTEVDGNTTIERWEEDTKFGLKQKQSVFTEVHTKYLLCHDSGETMELAGYGHGVDSQDKSAGKATTYAMKYALLYMGMVATGHIDDADKTHSDDVPTPKKTAPKKKAQPPKKEQPKETPKQPTITEEQITTAIEFLTTAETIDDLAQLWSLSKPYQKIPKFIEAKDNLKAKLLADAKTNQSVKK